MVVVLALQHQELPDVDTDFTAPFTESELRTLQQLGAFRAGEREGPSRDR